MKRKFQGFFLGLAQILAVFTLLAAVGCEAPVTGFVAGQANGRAAASGSLTVTGANGSIVVSGMNGTSLTVSYTSAALTACTLYVSQGNGTGLVLASQAMTYANGAYTYTLSNASFTSGATIYIDVLANNNGVETSVPQGTLGTTTSWATFSYGSGTAAATPTPTPSAWANWTPYDGTWSVVNGAYQVVNGPNIAKSVDNAAYSTAITLDADVQVVTSGQASLIWDVASPAVGTDAFQGYGAGIDTGGTVWAGKWNNGWTSMGSVSASISAGTWYHLQIIVTNGNFKVLLNGVQELSVNDSTYAPGGHVGVRGGFGNTDQFNNVVVGTTIPSTLPDLVVTNVTWSPSSVSAGTPVTFGCTVLNQGGTATPAGTKIGIAYNVDGTKVTWTGGYFPASGLAAGASVTLTADGSSAGPATWTATAGTHTVTALVDDVNLIAESNENNNLSANYTLNVASNLTYKDNNDTYSPGSGYSLVWSDEFNSGALDTTVWSYDTGAGGWGNNELEYYTPGNNISFVAGQNGNQYLAITAQQQSYGGANYTSARIKTEGNKSFVYAPGKTLKFVGRIQVPTALNGGVWPAFWMLGNNIGSVGWPECGEIDIMEAGQNGAPTTQVDGTLHWGPNTANAYSYGLTTNASANLGSGFHYYEADVNASTVTIYLDGVQYFVMNNNVSLNGYYYFQHDFFFLLNMAVGGNFPWPVTATFPQTMLVDWVRVYSN